MYKNMTVKNRLIAAFVIVTLIACVSGVVGVCVLKRTDTKYSEAITNYGYAQGDIGRVLTALSDSRGELRSVATASDSTKISEAQTAIEQNFSDISTYLEAVKPTLTTSEGKKDVEIFETAYSEYSTAVSKFFQQAGSTDDIISLAETTITETDTSYTEASEILRSLLELKSTTGTQLSDSLTSSVNTSLIIVMALIVISIILSVIVATKLTRGIVRPLNACADRLELLSQGDLRTSVPEPVGNDEISGMVNCTKVIVGALTQIVTDLETLLEEMSKGDFTVESSCKELYIGDFQPLLTSINGICSRLNQTMSQIADASSQVDAGADQVSSGAQALSQGATEQASSVQELAATINDISGHISANAENAHSANDLANRVGAELMESNHKMSEMTDAMSQIGEASNQIGKIIKTIEDIAFQTNILALNAAVEAARAGSAGKGFAVVADEVRNLAGKSQDAAKNTTALIENAISAVENGSAIADTTASAMDKVVSDAQEVVNIINSISGASREQAESIAQVTQGIDQISSVVQTNSATAEESAAASEELSGQARLLKDLLTNFKTTKSSGPSVVTQAPAAPKAPAPRQRYTPVNTNNDKY